VALEKKRIKENTYKTRQNKQRCRFFFLGKNNGVFFGVAMQATSKDTNYFD